MTNNYNDTYDGIGSGQQLSAEKMTTALNLMEKVANKVETGVLSGGNTSTQYPSAKVVWDSLKEAEDRIKNAGFEATANKVTTVTQSDTQYPTARAVYTALGNKEDAANKVTAANWAANKSSNVKYPTCAAVNALAVPNPESTTNKVTTVTQSDTQYPTARAVHTALGNKEDAANKVTAANWAANKDSDAKYPTCAAVNVLVVPNAESTTNKVTTVTQSDTQYPTARAVHTALGNKEDVANKVTTANWAANKSSNVKYPTCKAAAGLAGLL
ncbi:hypothetical protein NO2_1588, partial [Candidatus Termititenax persephonae]